MPKSGKKNRNIGMRLQDPSAADVGRFPEISDLVARLRFTPLDGRIALDDERMLLVHSKAMASLRRELIESLGIEKSRGLFTRMGYIAGHIDAELARAVRSDGEYFNAFVVGPQLHALEGIVLSEPVKFEYDPSSRHFYGEFIWRGSAENEEHIANYGIGTEPVCWSQVGYASGYTSAFVGRPILYREVKCRGMGDPHCVVIGKPVEDWDEGQDEMRFLQVPQAQPSAPAVSAHQRNAISVIPTTSARNAKATAVTATPTHGEVVGISAGFNATCHLIARVAPTIATVLLIGESGVGKERFARMLHETSPRAKRSFVAVNCAAIPDQLVESELFGAEKGAYTGASQSRPGYFEQASGGTLFLDEISTLGFVAQGKLLRVLQEREIQRVGDTQTRKVDVRVVAATNEDLRTKVKQGLFREDLFFRLNVFPIRIPPLRERREDVPFLMDYFFRKFCDLHQRSLAWFSPQAVETLMNYAWPGNIRELENTIERAVILAHDNETIETRHLFDTNDYQMAQDTAIPLSAPAASPVRTGENRQDNLLQDGIEAAIRTGTMGLEEITNACVHSAMSMAKGNVAQAARLLGLSRAQVSYRLRKCGDMDSPA